MLQKFWASRSRRIGGTTSSASQCRMDESDAAARAQAVWRRWMERLCQGSYTLRAAAELMNSSAPDAARVMRLNREGMLLAFDYAGEIWLPKYQFDGSEVRPVIARIISMARGAGVTDDETALWMVAPSSLFHQQDAPADHLDDEERLVRAGQLHFELEW